MLRVEPFRSEVSQLVSLALAATSSSTDHAVLATDGGAEFPHAVCAVASHLGTAAAQLLGEDETAFAAELWSLTILLDVIAEVACVTHTVSRVYIFSDSLSSLTVLDQKRAPLFRSRQWRICKEALKTAQDHRVCVTLHWVPSHGKEWRKLPLPSAVSEDEARRLNQLADTAATNQRRVVAESDGPWSHWQHQYETAERWSLKAIRYAREVFQCFSKWLRLDPEIS